MSKRALHKIYPYRWDWSAQPFLRMLISLVIGIGLYSLLQFRSPILFVALGSSVLFFQFLLLKDIGYEYNLVYGVMIQGMTILLGYSSAAYQHSIKDDLHFSHYIDNEDVNVYGLISGLKERANQYEAIVEVNRISKGDDWMHVTGNLNAYIRYKEIDTTLAIGQHIIFSSVIGVHPEPRNPEVFDYGSFLNNKHIYHQSISVSGVRIVSECQSYRFWMSRHRERLLQSLHRYIDNQSNYAIAASIILGYREDVDYSTKKVFSETGSIHILAVSGMHVGIVFAVLSLLLNLISNHRPLYRFIKIFLSLLGIWGFVLLAGAPPSAIRAAILFTIIVLSRLMPGQSSLYHRLATAAFVMLLWNTNYLYDVGFQLSFTAVLGIATFGPIWNRWYEPIHYWNRVLYDGTGLSIGATLGTLPLTLYYFHYFSISGLFASVIVVYFAVLILQVGVLFLGVFWLSLFFPAMAAMLYWVGYALNVIVGCLQSVVSFVHEIPGGLIPDVFISTGTVFLLYVLLISVRMLLDKVRKKVFIYGLSLSILGLGIISFVSKWDNVHINQIVIYHDYKHNAVEILEGRSAILISDVPVEERKSIFINKPFGVKRQVYDRQAFLTNGSFSSSNYAYHDGALKFYDQEILLVDNVSDISGMQGIHWDYVVLRNNSDITIDELFHNLTFDHVVFAASNWSSRVSDWIVACRALEINYIDINSTKALVIEIDKKKNREVSTRFL